jgi:hypothetical protein
MMYLKSLGSLEESSAPKARPEHESADKEEQNEPEVGVHYLASKVQVLASARSMILIWKVVQYLNFH